MMRRIFKITHLAIAVLLVFGTIGTSFAGRAKKTKSILKADDYKHYVDYFNRMEDENIIAAIPNSKSWDWMKTNIPLFECPQDNFEEMYYYRWWSFRKHIEETPLGYGITEFLIKRNYADKYNLIACALGHHIMEARWLHDTTYIDQDVHIWYRGNNGKPMAKLHKFSSWTPYALYQKYKVDGDARSLENMLPDLENDYSIWQKTNRLSNGLYWQYDVRDGMEDQISGGRHVKNARPTINSYMYGNAYAISKIAQMAGKNSVAERYKAKADTLKNLIETKLWDPEAQFFETLKPDGTFANVREEIGFIPWYFNIPGKENEAAWNEVKTTQGFSAPFGLTTAERSHPLFRSHGCCKCEWDGAIWPFATSQTLTGMANWVDQGNTSIVNDSVFFKQMELYVESQYHRGRPYIGEYLDEVTGYWLKGDQERSRYYNHSTFADLMISGLVGLRPRTDQSLEVSPLIPERKWAWFCLDNVLYHGKIITIFWDKDGTKYHRGKGLFVLVNGKKVGHADTLTRIFCKDALK